MSQQQFESHDIDDNKVVAALAYLIFFLPLILCPKSPFGKFHCNQGLNVFIVSVAASFLRFIPLIGWIIHSLVGIVVLVLIIYGIVHTLRGEAKELPIIGAFQLIS